MESIIDSFSSTSVFQYGDQTNAESLFIHVKEGKTFKGEKVLQLFMIYVPLCQRNNGLCKRLLDVLEKRAQASGKNLFIVGPLMEMEENAPICLETILTRRDYKPVPPFSMYKRFSQ